MDKQRTITRMKYFDHGQNGFYFVTLTTKDREGHFGKIKAGMIVPSLIGIEVTKCWNTIPTHFSFVELDSFTLMPNHIHGIIFINKNNLNKARFEQNLNQKKKWQSNPNKFGHQSNNIASIIRGFKIGVTKFCRESTDIYTIWQRNYHLRVIMNKQELNNTRKYIHNNPRNWINDELFDLK